MMAKEKPPITVVGDVGGRIAIIVVRLRDSSHMHPEFTALDTQTRTAREEKLRRCFLTDIVSHQ